MTHSASSASVSRLCLPAAGGKTVEYVETPYESTVYDGGIVVSHDSTVVHNETTVAEAEDERMAVETELRTFEPIDSVRFDEVIRACEECVAVLGGGRNDESSVPHVFTGAR
jgi:hypothetical protein